MKPPFRTAFAAQAFFSVINVFLASAPLAALDPVDAGPTLPPGFRAVVVADTLVVGKHTGNTPGVFVVAPNGDTYAKFVRSPLRP